MLLREREERAKDAPLEEGQLAGRLAEDELHDGPDRPARRGRVSNMTQKGQGEARRTRSG